ncbi:uncharacterized protein LOC124455287 [Xenia sp. Carnegie-2017]|uniref:uncharacterized protein LOC124455287 n=1 Tax=Xenia sp. Carnegie-2017 TaxID=2897299 RepID=UPI001F034410|nr:uncharacterized protein LOC124455287 [Xenia sp. Carnegie-2017]
MVVMSLMCLPMVPIFVLLLLNLFISECALIVSIMKEIAEGLLVSVDLVEKFVKNPNDKSAKDISTLFAKISDENVDVNTEIRNSSNRKSSQNRKFEKDDDVTGLLTSGSEANETLEARLDRLNSENNRLNHKISELEERHNAIMIELFLATEKVKECQHVFIDNPGIINDGKWLGYPNYKNCKYATNCSNEDLKDVPKVVISTNDMNEYFHENQKLNYNKKKSEEKRPEEVKSLVISDKRKRNVEMKPEGNIENDTMNDEGMKNNEDRQERNDNEEMMTSSDMSQFNEEDALPFSVQQDESNNYENISLKSAPPISVASSLFVNYKMMLLTIPERLLSSDVTAMKEWARRQFSIEHAQDATEILRELDRRLIISASNLSVLHSFFESIIRFDLIYIIDGYLTGDYSVFKNAQQMKTSTRKSWNKIKL